MKPSVVKLLSIFFFFFIHVTAIQSCKKERSKEGEDQNIPKIESKPLKIHQSKIQSWIKYIPLDGRFKNTVSIKSKTIQLNDQLITNIQIGEKGNSFLFISDNNKFHAYGLISGGLNNKGTGVVDILDFQTIRRQGLRFIDGKLTSFLSYPHENLINAYTGYYALDEYRNKVKLTANGNQRTTDETGLISSIRRFFCQLFGGSWVNSIAGNSTNPNGSCDFSSGIEGVPQEITPGESGGGIYWGDIYPHINDMSFFDLTSSMWNNINADLNAGNTSFNWAITTPASTIDVSCLDPEKVKSLFFILNTKSNQQPAQVDFGTLEETLSQYQTYKSEQQVPLPIAPLLLKAGPNGTVDALLQAQYIYLTENNSPSFGAAFGHDNFNKTQAASSITGGLTNWRIQNLPLGTSAFYAVEDVLVNLIDGVYGENNYSLMGNDFISGFYTGLGVPGGGIDAANPKNSLNSINPTLYSNVQVLKLNAKQGYYLWNRSLINEDTKNFLRENEYSDEAKISTKIVIDLDIVGILSAPNTDQHFNIALKHFPTCCPTGPILSGVLFKQLNARITFLKSEHPDWSTWKCMREAYLEILHLGLDILGTVPIGGEVFDVAGGVIYLVQGDGANATLNFVQAVPFLGWGGLAAKYARKTLYFADGTKSALNWYKRTDGSISFGKKTSYSSKQFRKLLGLLPGDTRQAHHIIPWELCDNIGQEVIQKAASARFPFHVQDILNGIPLTAAQHMGSHPNYTIRVSQALAKIKNDLGSNFTPETAYHGIVDLTNKIKAAILANPNTPIDQIIF